jgi:hypothetical protein
MEARSISAAMRREHGRAEEEEESAMAMARLRPSRL